MEEEEDEEAKRGWWKGMPLDLSSKSGEQCQDSLGNLEGGDAGGVPQLPLSSCGCSCFSLAAAPPPSAFLLAKHPVGRWVHPTPPRDFSLSDNSDTRQ